MSPSFFQELLIVFVCAVLAVDALIVDMSVTYSNSSYPGLSNSTATMVCSWTRQDGEVPGQLIFYRRNSGDSRPIFTFTVGSVFVTNVAQAADWDADRMSSDPVNSSSTSVVLRLSRLQCSDEGGYICRINYESNSQTQAPIEQEQLITLKSPPESPRLEFITADPSQGLLENSPVQVSCEAMVGSINMGGLHWRIYRGDVEENIPSTDSRITVSTQRNQCTETVESTLSLTVTRRDQNLVITCFVTNQEFAPESSLPAACTDSALCEQTPTIRIHYPVSEQFLTLTSEPQDVYAGGSVTLSCRADAFPEAEISWLRGNETLTGERDGVGGSRLLLTDLRVDEDSGDYNCTATNTVQQIVYSASRELTIDVSATPPPTTQPPTTTPSTREPGGDGNADTNTGGGGDDNTVIIVVVIVVVVVLLIVAVVGFLLYRRRNAAKSVEEPTRKPANNASNNLAFVNGVQPDLVADDKYRTPSLNNSFDVKNEDGLMYADLTYDNRPRSRKPLAIGDNASDYSDIQMPQV